MSAVRHPDASGQIFDFAVVGAGMFGSAAARYLSRNANVVVVGPSEPAPGSPGNQYEFGAHFDEARITRRLGWDDIWGTLDTRSLERFSDIEQASGMRFFDECGSLVLIAGSIQHRTEAILNDCSKRGIKVSRLDAASLGRQFPQIGLPDLPGGVEGLFEPERAGYLNPRLLVSAQLRIAEAQGAQVLRTAVVAVDRPSGRVPWRLTRQDGAGHIFARKVLVATGALTNQNGALPEGTRLALHAFTEPNLLFEVDDAERDRLIGIPPIVTVDPEDSGNANMSTYILPPIRYSDGRWRLRIGPGMQPIVEELHSVDAMVSWYQKQTVTHAQRELLATAMRAVFPGLRTSRVTGACCIIEKTPSRYPYIGFVDDDLSVGVVVGGNGHGARGSDEIGRLAARLMQNESWDSEVPKSTFEPIRAETEAPQTAALGRPAFLKPPFGLC